MYSQDPAKYSYTPIDSYTKTALTVQFLLSQGANINAKDAERQAMLHYVANYLATYPNLHTIVNGNIWSHALQLQASGLTNL